ncbi:MAG: DUF2807 domain-containing protein [Isosphaeraceae bacterium]
MLRRARFLLLLAIPGCAVGLAQGVPGNGVIATLPRDVGDFQAIEIRGALAATVELGPKPSVEIEGDENLIPMVTTVVQGGRLIVAVERGQSIRPTRPIALKITTPAWDTLEIQGASQATARADGAESLRVKVLGASTAKLSGVGAKELILDAQGASKVEATGHAQVLKLALGGASNARLDQLEAEDVHVSAEGACSASVKANAVVDGKVSGASEVKVSGPALRRSIQASGASRVVYSKAAANPGPAAP